MVARNILFIGLLALLVIPFAHALEPEQQAQKVVVTINNSLMYPGAVYLQKGVPAELTIVNNDRQAHGFGAYELNLIGRIEPGETKTFQIPTDKAGEFKYYCAIYCGSKHYSMEGTIVISEEAMQTTPQDANLMGAAVTESIDVWQITSFIFYAVLAVVAFSSLAYLYLLDRLSKTPVRQAGK